LFPSSILPAPICSFIPVSYCFIFPSVRYSFFFISSAFLSDSMWPLPNPFFSYMMQLILSGILIFLYYLKMGAGSSSKFL
jgi:hypothetical protein